MTADELLEIARKGRPNVRYTKNAKNTAIGAWANGRWNCVAGLMITGEWCEMGDLFIDGKPCITDWINE